MYTLTHYNVRIKNFGFRVWGFNTFMRYYGSHFDVLHNGKQLIVQRVT